MIASVLLALCVVGAQTASGSVLWMWGRRSARTTLVEAIGMGLALGSLLALIGSQITLALGAGVIGWILPVLLAALLVVLRQMGQVDLGGLERGAKREWISMTVVAASGLVSLIPGFVRTPVTHGYLAGNSYHGDLVFFESVAQFLARLGPTDSSLLADFGIRYHWLSYGWIGFITEASGAGPFVVMVRVFPIVVTLGASLLAVAWASRLSTRKWTPLLAGLLVVVAGFVGASQGVVLNFDSPSTAYAALLALAFGLAMTDYFTDSTKEVSRWIAPAYLALLAAGMLGAKISQGIVVAAGLLVVGISVSRTSTPQRRKAWTLVGAVFVAMLVTYIIIIAGVAPSDTNIAVRLAGDGASTFQGLDPSTSRLGVLLGSLALVGAIVPRWLGLIWLGRKGESAGQIEPAFAIGLAAAGLAPIFLLSSGTNAAWFAVAASAPLAVLSAAGLERSWNHIGAPLWRFIFASALAAIGVNIAVFVAYAFGVVSGAPVLWRVPLAAWVAAGALGFLIALAAHRKSGRLLLAWLAAATTVLVFTSVGARFNGAVLWSMTQEQLTPVVQDAIQRLDPSAEFPSSDASSERNVTNPSRPPVNSATNYAGDPAQILQWSAELNEAAQWLEPQVDTGTLVAMDATYLQPFLPVVTNISMYVAGEPYISGYTTAAGAAAAHTRKARTEAFLSAPSSATAQDLWNDRVRWIWLKMTPDPNRSDFEPWASVTLATEEVVILRLNDPDANSE